MSAAEATSYLVAVGIVVAILAIIPHDRGPRPA